MNSSTDFGGNFLSSLRILTSRISMACSGQYWKPSRGALTTKWRAWALKEVTWTGISWKDWCYLFALGVGCFGKAQTPIRHGDW